RDCLINSLRMRPDRILVGECRRDETFEMLQAMNTGHDGSMTTIHSNSSRDCLSRLESLILTSNVEMPLPALRKQMASAIDLVVQLKRHKSGQRIVQEITEVTGMEQTTITMQSVFSREKKKIAAPAGAANVHGIDPLLAVGIVPSFIEKFSDAGIQFPANFFDASTSVTYRPE
ncbi:MAG: CpaF family protein, partial [Proteobacteria bacterium]